MASTASKHDIRLPGGRTGTPLQIATANPKNPAEAIAKGTSLATFPLPGTLFVPDGDGPFPVVIVVPGSLGLAPSHLAKSELLVEAGIAACPIEPFLARSVTSTIANQTQYSFAASAWDVLVTAAALAERPEIDATRIGAQGHSRGGSAVLTAAAVPFAAAHPAPKLRAVYAAYPWSGHQFERPELGGTRVRAIIGDRDDWCSVQQVQAHVHAMTLAGGDATLRIVDGAHHSFDRATPFEALPDARVAPAAPTVYLADDGAMIHPVTNAADPELVDRDLMVYAIKAGFGREGAHIAGREDLAPVFDEDMLAFWRSALEA
ncbi:MAG: dienelactone hydrolase family protein [Myxococcota bacterium]